MIRRLAFAFLLLCVAAPAAAQSQTGATPVVAAGTIVDLGVVPSKYTDPRRVVVWLPSGYNANGPKHAVLYMHDGQNLFDTKTAGFGMEWQIDETLDRLIREKKVRPTIVVGIWSTPKRLQEYVPSKAFEGLPPEYREKVRALYGGDPLSDGYLKFLVRELKPMIDKRFNVRTDPADTPMPDQVFATVSTTPVSTTVTFRRSRREALMPTSGQPILRARSMICGGAANARR